MPGTPLRLALLALLALAPLSADAACPSYPYNTLTNRCWQDGFCIWHDLEARTIDDGMLEEDNPSEAFTVQAGPVADMASAMQGSGDLFGLVDAEVETGQAFVRGAADGDAAAQVGDSGSAGAQTIAALRVTDLVFTGPAAEVDASLNLGFEATSSQVTIGVGGATAITSMTALVGGAICNGPEHMTFRGEKTHSLQDNSTMDDFFVVSVNTGVLMDVPLDDVTDLVVGPFTVPTGVPLDFEIWIQTVLATATGGGDAGSTYDFTLYAGPPGGGLVFVLPDGYRADSDQAGIVDSRTAVPEPGALLSALVGAAVLALFQRRRHGA